MVALETAWTRARALTVALLSCDDGHARLLGRFTGSAESFAFGFSASQPGPGSFEQQVAFHFGDSCQHRQQEFEAARALARRLYPADQGYAYLYPGDPRLRMSAIRLLVPRD